MLVGLYTSRVVIDALGVEDYGVYNLVGGFVAMFSVVQSGLVSASQRFLNTYLGIGDKENLKQLFSTIVLIYLMLSLVAFVLVESFGMYIFENQLNIPIERLDVAKWTFQFSVILLIASLVGAPFNALIISYEKMEVYAYVSIFDSIAKFIIAELIYFSGVDKLLLYSILLCIESIIVQSIYWIFCMRNFEEAKISWILNWRFVKEIYSFAIWSMLGGFAFMGFTQGVNVLLGIFFTPSIVAARGIAVQVQSVIKNFANNFQTAVNPQIIKSYAQKNKDFLENLLLVSSKYSYLLMILFALPFFFEAEGILSIWLVEVPQDTPLFLRLILVTVIIDTATTPFEKAIQASGIIRTYSVSTSITFLTIVPISFLVLKLGYPPYSVFVVHLVITIIAVLIRMYMAKIIVKIDLAEYIRKCVIPAGKVSFATIMLLYVVRLFFAKGIFMMFITLLISTVGILLFTYMLGMSVPEKNAIKKAIYSRLSK